MTLVYGAAAADLPGNHSMLPNLAVALFILPFFLFSAPVHGKDASATGLQKIVAGLRADWQ